MSSADSSSILWSWSPTSTTELTRRVRLAALALAVATVVSAVIAAVTPGRFVIVITVMLAGICGFWWLEHRRFSTTVVSLDAAGMLRVRDGRSDASIDLSIVDTVDVELRTRPGVTVLASQPRWMIELAGPGATLTHGIAHAGGLFNADPSDVERLETELRSQAQRLARRRALGAEAEEPVNPAAPSGVAGERRRLTDPLDVAVTEPDRAEGAVAHDSFVWRPPVSPHADRRRLWFRLGYGGAALAIAVYAVVSMWGDWAAVILSALTVPGLIVACCGGLDYMLGRARRFVVHVDDGVLRIDPERAPGSIALAGSTVDLDRTSQLVGTSNGTVRSTSWLLSVTAADGTVLKRQLPQWGTVTTEDDYVALRRELRQRT